MKTTLSFFRASAILRRLSPAALLHASQIRGSKSPSAARKASASSAFTARKAALRAICTSSVSEVPEASDRNCSGESAGYLLLQYYVPLDLHNIVRRTAQFL